MEEKTLIRKFLKSKNFNDYGIAGLMGNLYAESGLRANNMEDQYQSKLGFTDASYTAAVDNGTYTNFIYDSVGYGLAQWTYWSRKRNLLNYAKSQNKSIGDLQMQLEFLVKELEEQYTSTVFKVLQTASTIEEATAAVLYNYERPANMQSLLNQRTQFALMFYEQADEQEVEMMIKTYTKKQKTQLSTNFVSTEFDCHGSGCCPTTLIDDQLVVYLQKIRDHFGKPITITSGYRCETHNRRVGGATGSYHSKGQAADIVVQGITPREVAKYAESIGILGIGLYETSKDGYFVHVDTRTKKSFWYGQSEQGRTTFGGSTTSSGASSGTSSSTSSSTVTSHHGSSKKYSISLYYLQYGDRGRDIQILQQMLVNRGYEIDTDGIFGNNTRNAVKDFQKKVGLSADGIVGADTMTKLLTT